MNFRKHKKISLLLIVGCWLITFRTYLNIPFLSYFKLNIFWTTQLTLQITLLWTNAPTRGQFVQNALTIPGFLGIPAGTSTREQPFTQSANCSSPKWDLTSLIVSMWLRSFPTPIRNKVIFRWHISIDWFKVCPFSSLV